jgi:hypothetical protein
MRAGKIALVVIGVIIALMSFGLVVGGGTLLWAYGTQRDADGFFTSRTYDFATESNAITTEDLRFGAEPGDWWPSGDVATLKLAATGERAVFVGIGPRQDVETYLADVGRAVVDDVNPFNSTPDLEVVPGTAPATPPGEQAFWTVSAEGEGTQTVTWDIEQGNWTAVLMNADGSEGISADVVAGAKVAFILGIAIGMVVFGILLGLAAAALLVAGLRGRPPADELPADEIDATGRPVGTTGMAATGAPAGTGGYPARLEGRIEPGLSRWMWLVKWLLAIPHFIVLAFLFVAFIVTTFVAALSILFTRRYPRGLFDFNVGVIRWGWRVSFYCAAPVAADAYPPFSLAPADYPASFDVVYPADLNRWLPLVKWFLAIPHLIIVGLFTTGLVWWIGDLSAAGGDMVLRISGGLISFLTFIALVVLLFTGRYPQGIFDLVMGMERWTYRTWAYVALMTDDYPPFRLDMGPTESSTLPGGPAGETEEITADVP